MSESVSAGPDVWAAVDAALDAVSSMLSGSPGDTAVVVAGLGELGRLRNRLAAVETELLACAERVRREGRVGATSSVADLLVQAQPLTARAAASRVELALTWLSDRCSLTGEPLPALAPVTAAGMRAGVVSVEQARVIVDTLEALPAEVTPKTVAIVESTLVDACPHLHVPGLKRMAGLLLARLDQDGPEPDDGERARAGRGLSWRSWRDGLTRWTLDLPAQDNEIFRAVIDALSAPDPARQPDPSGCTSDPDAEQTGAEQTGAEQTDAAQTNAAQTDVARTGDASGHARVGDARVGGVVDSAGRPPAAVVVPDPRTASQRRADGLIQACTRLVSTGTLPSAGGAPVSVLVTMTLDQLEARRGVAVTDRGTPWPVPQLLDAAADYLPLITQPNGAPLFLGRTARLASVAQRRALAARDGGCVFPRCDRPPSWCEVHHVTEWATGGATDLDNLVLLCGYHHREFARQHWQLTMINGLPEWTPPPWLRTSRADGGDPDRSSGVLRIPADRRHRPELRFRRSGTCAVRAPSCGAPQQ